MAVLETGCLVVSVDVDNVTTLKVAFESCIVFPAAYRNMSFCGLHLVVQILIFCGTYHRLESCAGRALHAD